MAIERALVVDPEDSPGYYYHGIVGADRCRAHTPCNLDSGIVVDDAARTVTFHLTAPDPEFLYKLALPAAFAVPQGTPLTELTNTFAPATGPYMIASDMKGKGHSTVVLVRNPMFHEWSGAAQPQGYPDRIEESFGVTPKVQVSQVEHGLSDATGEPPPADQLSQLETHYPSQLHVAVSTTIIGFQLNTKVAPFKNPDARKAVSYAIDRRKLVRLFGGSDLNELTCQILPTGFPGYRPYCPYTIHPNASGTWSAPDMKKAHQLVTNSGTRGDSVIISTSTQGEPALNYIAHILTDLGYQPHLNVIPNLLTYFTWLYKHPGAQMSLYDFLPDYPNASGIIVPLFDCHVGSNPVYFCSPLVQAAIRRALKVQATNPPAAGDAWARADEEVVDQAAWLSMPSPKQIHFMSSRTGNVEVNLQWGLLLDQLWVH